MWEPRRPTTLWAFASCYRDSFTFYAFTFDLLAWAANTGTTANSTTWERGCFTVSCWRTPLYHHQKDEILLLTYLYANGKLLYCVHKRDFHTKCMGYGLCGLYYGQSIIQVLTLDAWQGRAFHATCRRRNKKMPTSKDNQQSVILTQPVNTSNQFLSLASVTHS
jgi:hypothetical protein